MSRSRERSDPARFEPHAGRALGHMFSGVSRRYDLLNSILSLGQDRAWRAAMWRAVPDGARTVLDLCTGSGVSLPGLRRPGRVVLGIDVSRPMLDLAAAREGRAGWAPRLVAADGFHLPLADRSLDAVTIAFGIRNLRPLDRALAEIGRVLRPGGTLAVLEAAAPAPGPFAPFHAFYLRHLVPLAGRLSPDPSAYEYLSRSVFEFGAGPEFERALARAGFRVRARRGFLAGATRLWAAEREGAAGQNLSHPDLSCVQNARPGSDDGVKVPTGGDPRSAEWRIWTGVQLALAVALTATLLYGLSLFANSRADLPLGGSQRRLAEVLLVGGVILFALRTVQLLLRFLGPRQRP